MELREAEDGDPAEVGRLHHRSRVAAYAGLVERHDLGEAESFAEWWTERYRWEKETHRLTVAEDAGRITGFTYTGPAEDDDAAELYAIHVEPDHVGTGLGRRLMGNAIELLREVGRPDGVLWVVEGNAVTRRFYDRGGWRADGGERVEPIGGRPVRQLRYRRRL